MTNAQSDRVFAGSIPQLYERYLVPLIFQPYADDLLRRLTGRPLTRILELAAGTGVVTRALAAGLPKTVSIVATDLQQPMLDQAARTGTKRPVEWRQADAMALPFGDGSFDAVICQFGAMFFPDKTKAFAEARRVLRSPGIFMFNVWDRIEDNEFADATTEALRAMYPSDPPLFLARTPHGYHDPAAIRRDLAGGGFRTKPAIATVTKRSRAESARIAAVAYCEGTPLRNELEARGAERLHDATDAAARLIAQRFGDGPVDGKIQAHVVAVET
jgi:SAM-dependent methyltransferase